ncbi:hypothetical protein CCH79_00020733 [Gambusia affinis]|uniref:Uncharacterized protein n=1 Tax=Gambusia affinis TaxID=33528 RepID=A0A315WBS1_GAMAF|nr:hypothetical protein CCH79_00020733 [Gambusia affinis]
METKTTEVLPPLGGDCSRLHHTDSAAGTRKTQSGSVFSLTHGSMFVPSGPVLLHQALMDPVLTVSADHLTPLLVSVSTRQETALRPQLRLQGRKQTQRTSPVLDPGLLVLLGPWGIPTEPQERTGTKTLVYVLLVYFVNKFNEACRVLVGFWQLLGFIRFR